MIKQKTSLESLPEKIRTKLQSKDLMYVEDVECITIETVEELQMMVRGLLANEHKVIGFDTEATSPRPDTASIVGMSFAFEDYRGFYVPVGHLYGEQLPLEVVLETITPVLQSGRLSMAGGKYDWQLMKRHGVDVRYGIDSQVMSRLLNEVEYGVGLKQTVARMFGEQMVEFNDVMTPAARKKGESFANIEIGLAALYAVPDAIYTRRVSRYAMRNMPEGIKKLLLKVDHEAMRIAGEMEYVGAPLDAEFLERHTEAGEAMYETLRTEAIEGLKAVAVRRGRDASEVPDDLNMNSAPQMQKVLFDVCGFEPVRFSKKTKRPSADKASIEKMAERDPEVDWVRRVRSVEARLRDLREFTDFGIEENGWLWVHGSLNPTGTATGRWSSSGPNLQNISKGESVYESRNSEWKIAPRDAIAAPPGWYIVTADYSQIELRVAAGESQCRMWQEAFTNGDDVHSASGAAIHNVPISEVTSKQRGEGKTYNFALLFGQEVKSTAASLGIPLAEAQRMQNAFWSGLPEVKSWIDRVQSGAKKNLYVETHFGRRRWLRGLESDNKWIVLENLRESVNTVVQGTAADVLKIGLMRQESVAKELGARLFLVVHDQYVWLVPETTRPDVFCQRMDEVINFEIPGYPEMISDYSIGKRFNSLVDFASAFDVPATWDEVFQERPSSTPSETDQTLNVTVDVVSMDQLLAFTKLLEEHPGPTGVTLTVESLGKELDFEFQTSLGPEDELLFRSALTNTAKVTLV